ncbi:hypothetical protein WDU94_005060 [Cyamophila willieti]
MQRIRQLRKSIPKIEIEKSTFDLIQDYTQHSSVHGVRYMSNKNAPFIERIFWLLVLVVCILFAYILNSRLWARYKAIPTVLAVQDTHVPLYLFPFPSVTICPANKVKKSAALEYFSRYINISEDPQREKALVHVMSALSLMQKPSYYRMAPHINASMMVLPLLSEVNISDFMLHVLPKCEEVFGTCSWHGKNVNCCEIFSLQKTEEGYCFSFNSLTSEEGKHCETEGIAQRDLNGAKVIVHTSYEYPDAGDGVWLPSTRGKKLSIAVFSSITGHLRLLRPPDGTPGFDSLNIKHSLNCSRCAPTCYNTEYDLEVNYTPDPRPKVWHYSGHLDIFYGALGAKRYLRDITFTSSDLLVNIGGVANLFLGFSLLSVVEFVYWFFKIIIIIAYRAWMRRRGASFQSNN